MLFDTHSHVKPWSHDASQTIDQLLNDAEQKGLAGICLTDHYEKDLFYERGYEDIFDPDEYFRHLGSKRLDPNSAAKQGKPAFLIGAELGWLPHLRDHLIWLTSNYPFDSIILSMHVFRGYDPYIDENFFSEGIEAVYPEAIADMVNMIETFSDFDILGHFDYVSRYYKSENAKMLYKHAPDQFDSLFKKMVEHGKCLEINTRTTVKMRSMGYTKSESLPDPDIIKRYLELGGKYISIGSDSHHNGDAALIFSEMKEWLQSNGVNRLTYFVERKPVEYII